MKISHQVLLAIKGEFVHLHAGQVADLHFTYGRISNDLANFIPNCQCQRLWLLLDEMKNRRLE